MGKGKTMNTKYLLCGLFVLAICCPSYVNAEDKQEPEVIKSSIEKDVVESCLGACRVNFRKELGVDLEYLDSIGVDIHNARKTPDPVALALCAKGLAVAEQVSGKKASYTSTQVMQEAVKLAKLRGYSAELSGLAVLADAKDASDLKELAEVAKGAEEEARIATENGDASKELIGSLQVANHSHECLRIYMDGRYLGTVHEGHTQSFHVHNHNWHNHFDAYCAEGGELVQHANYSGHAHFLSWHIH